VTACYGLAMRAPLAICSDVSHDLARLVGAERRRLAEVEVLDESSDYKAGYLRSQVMQLLAELNELERRLEPYAEMYDAVVGMGWPALYCRCGLPILPKRSNGRNAEYCSQACRQSAYRARRSAGPVTTGTEAGPTGVFEDPPYI
jgi:hypothetical protein